MVNRGCEIFLSKNFAVISDRGNIPNTRQLGIFYTLSRWNFEYQKSFDSKNRADICFEWKILISSTSIQTRLLTELKLNPEFLSIRSNFSIDFPSFQSPSIARNGSSISWSEVTCFLFETFEIPGSPFIVTIDLDHRPEDRFQCSLAPTVPRSIEKKQVCGWWTCESWTGFNVVRVRVCLSGLILFSRLSLKK